MLDDIFTSKPEHSLLRRHIGKTERDVRYVDDTSVLCIMEKQAALLPKASKVAQMNHRFTCEHEFGNRIPFLDVDAIHNSDGSISRMVPRKHKWT